MTDLDPTRTEGEGETLDMPEGLGTFKPGQILGDRYQIRSLLGRGGMGEVWHAFDLKLRVEVALKALREDLFKSDRRREALREEVRTAREVMSPNVCRVFDLQEVDGRELVSMEYVDGQTLLEVLHDRGPLDLKDAQDIASQFLAGLEAIHKVGLVHRDIKPENIMLTRAGRIVVMDFGIARQEAEGGGTVSGTPAYMAPEQAAGETLDARADVYSAGVVLAEMVSPEGIRDFKSRQSVWEGLRSEPAKIPDTPWAPVLEKAVSRDRDRRYRTAHTLTRALEDVTLRVEGAEDLHPYPGLASFTENDAEYFFGREAEVEQMWRRFDRPHLIGLIGPSGAGKTSFLNAGVVPSAPAACGVVRCSPGAEPIAGLRYSLAAELAGDAEAVQELVRGDEVEAIVAAVARWRRKHDQAVLIFDQFEELFTQNPPDIQERFASLASRIALEADTFVVLSMRDDFLMACNRFEDLRAVFTDLMALDPPVGANLRRALVQPAQKCGYRFEDDELAEEMLAEVEGERGALPLLAFASSRLWEMRVRETGLLTRQAYQDIGGVGGALAQHAEATIDRIGVERIPIVRDLFRNLVTAEGTRAIREWDELLSVFSRDDQREGINPSPTNAGTAAGAGFTPARDVAEEVLRELIDARLLTSYEVREDEHDPVRRVEIIHESLLANWPRLVRWQTQDADAAQLRDQLRQAAKTWDDQGRADDTLWTGAAYREFALWRERYPGGLTESEEAFSAAMTSFAGRRRRRRRMVVASVLAAATLVAAVTTALWRRSVVATRRAEAQKLVALARLELDSFPTSALAHATASLELFDTLEARHLAVESLWKGQLVSVLPAGSQMGNVFNLTFSPDGRLLAAAGATTDGFFVWTEKGDLIHESGTEGTPAFTKSVAFAKDGKILVHGNSDRVDLWEVPEFELINTLDLSDNLPNADPVDFRFSVKNARLLRWSGKDSQQPVQSWPLDGGPPTHLGSWTGEVDRWVIDRMGDWIAFSRGRELFLRPFSSQSSARHDRLLGRHREEITWVTWSPTGEAIVSRDASMDIRLWPVQGDGLHSGRTLRGIARLVVGIGPNMSFLIDIGMEEGSSMPGYRRWDLGGPPDARPHLFDEPPGFNGAAAALHPNGRWMADSAGEAILFYSFGARLPHVLKGHDGACDALGFTADGRFLCSGSRMDHTVRIWPLSPDDGERGRILLARRGVSTIASHPSSESIMIANGFSSVDHGVVLMSLSEGDETARNLWPDDSSRVVPIAFDEAGRWAAAGAIAGGPDAEVVIRVHDLESGVERVLPLRNEETSRELGAFAGGVGALRFTADNALVSVGSGGIRSWDLESGSVEWQVRVDDSVFLRADISRDSRFVLFAVPNAIGSSEAHDVTLYDLEEKTSHRIVSHGQAVNRLAISDDGSVVATSAYDVVRVGLVDGSEPHLLFGHDGEIGALEFSPDGRWIASAAEDFTLRLWPMPDLTRPPLHSLPREELITKLRSLTNFRVVRQAESPTGWKLDIGPFRGWAEVPEW